MAAASIPFSWGRGGLLLWIQSEGMNDLALESYVWRHCIPSSFNLGFVKGSLKHLFVLNWVGDYSLSPEETSSGMLL